MIVAQAFDLKTKETRSVEAAELDEALRSVDGFVWIDFESDSPAEFLARAGSLGVELGEAAVFDRPEILPRLVESPSFLAFHLYEIADSDKHLDTSGAVQELDVERLVLVVGQRFVLTYHSRPLSAVEAARLDAGRSFRLWGKTPGFLAFLLLERCLYDYAHLNLANDNSLDRLEEAVLVRDSVNVAAQVATIGRNILLLKKLGSSLQIVLMALSGKRSVFVSDEAREFYHEMLQNAISVRAAIDSSRDLLDGVVASLQAQSAQRTAEVARLLTIVSTVMLPLTVITGIYGMNFKHMPELEMPGAYYAVLGLLAVVAGLLLTSFWRIGWFRTSGGLIQKDKA